MKFITKFIILIIGLTNIYSSNLSGWEIKLPDDKKYSFYDGFIEFNFNDQTRWQDKRVTLNYGIFSQDVYYKLIGMIGDFEDYVRITCSNTLLSVTFYGGEIINVTKDQDSVNRNITYTLKVNFKNVEKPGNVNLIFTITGDKRETYDKFINDIIQHKDGNGSQKVLNFLEN